MEITFNYKNNKVNKVLQHLKIRYQIMMLPKLLIRVILIIKNNNNYRINHKYFKVL